MQFEYPIGATPIDADEAVGLIPTRICNQADNTTQFSVWPAFNSSS